MQQLVIRRLYQAFFVLIGTTLIVFALLHLTGGSIARSLLPEWSTEEQIAAFEAKLGLDRPIPEQYLMWLSGVVRGDFGNSFTTGLPAMDIILERLPNTIQLALVAQLIALLVAFPLGMLAALKRGSIWDRISMAFALLGQSMPHFWLGLMLILIVSVRLGWLPVSGKETPQSIILPAITLATGPIAILSRLVRSGMIEVMGHDYVRTARAKGLSERLVLSGHALRNALLPLITVIGLEIGSLLNGSVVVEAVFAWPGIGRLLVEALQRRDIPVVEAGVLLVAVMYVGLNLVVDILYGWVDPRVRYA
ncbi:MAG: binding-protein-dependent transport system inner rane component [Thermomicrobiales bacterium]|jgi:peptide/nickel transport system permease protein|nr:binding-protein-dependent transport system inner rane component [Thermomicrobiales bacterium]MDF3041093.1 binding-protein-dependent transport system inner rane component [Thermomicrobiales bacterium]